MTEIKMNQISMIEINGNINGPISPNGPINGDIYKQNQIEYRHFNNFKNKNYDKNYEKIICLNCGKKGHIQKKCKYPKNSYGIISYKFNPENLIQFLMIQRKFSHSLLNLIYAKYYKKNILDERSLISIIQLLPLNERYLIKKYDFDYINNQLWTIHVHSVECNICCKSDDNKKKFIYFKNNYLFLLDTIPILHYEPDWEFPKGKRIIGETNIKCAIREFNEETAITLDISDIKNDAIMFKEYFFGTNNKEYCNNYFISKYNKPNKVYYNYNNENQVSEIRKIGWFTLPQILNKISHQPHKINLIKSIYNSGILI